MTVLQTRKGHTMRVFESYRDIPSECLGAVVAMGNFDGVHKGHQALLHAAKDIAHKQGRPLAVLTFEPHPRALLRPDDPPARITPLDLKRYRLARQGVDITYSLPFDWALASMPAPLFLRDVLTVGIKAAHIVVGRGFRFGQLRGGGTDDMRAAGIPVLEVDMVTCEGGEALSASRIRALLRHGRLLEAKEALGWAWEIWGIVCHGDKRGRTLGYPTANVNLGGAVHPSYGVYAGQVRLEGEQIWRTAALNIGIRPMFAAQAAQAEAHILDFAGDLYGQTIRIKPIERLRGEAKFESIEALIAQMAQDCAATRKILQN